MPITRNILKLLNLSNFREIHRAINHSTNTMLKSSEEILLYIVYDLCKLCLCHSLFIGHLLGYSKDFYKVFHSVPLNLCASPARPPLYQLYKTLEGVYISTGTMPSVHRHTAPNARGPVCIIHASY